MLLLWEIWDNDESGGAARVIPELAGSRRLLPLTGQLTFWNPNTEGISINHKEDKVDLTFWPPCSCDYRSERGQKAAWTDVCNTDTQIFRYIKCVKRIFAVLAVDLQWRVGAYWLSYSCLAVSNYITVPLLHKIFYNLWDNISLFTWETFISLLPRFGKPNIVKWQYGQI